ncbi:MAG: tannase/feruloyl esterase family alpha/beta hydrolase [Burkholderiaceae bacterium]|jgi:feruloyl esterase
MRTYLKWWVATLFAGLYVLFLSPVASAATCASLATLALPNATITTATSITGGSFTPPGSTTALTGLPDFCRVSGIATPTSDSIITFEVWIPTDGTYNGKFEQLGCGGFCGSISYAGLAEGIERGFATAATDDGSQTGGTALFALGHPEKIVDFGYRALKETTDKSKDVIAALVGKGPTRSYFNGCSDGGREALMEAQRFPNDFDGIIVGSPANYWTHLLVGAIYGQQALLIDPASYVPPTLLPVLTSAVLAQCAGKDGGLATDDFLNNPLACHFDPAKVQCASGQDPTTCLSAAQVKAVRAIYTGVRNPVTGRQIFPGLEPGEESNPANWPVWITGALRVPTLSNNLATGESLAAFFGYGFFADMVFQNPAFDYTTFNFTSDVAYTDKKLAGILNSTNPDLSRFKEHGGKMIHYVGWGDSAISPRNTLNYYHSVQNEMGGEESVYSFYRLFMVPGMSHCSGGPGANAFGNALNGPVVDARHDLLKALDKWVEEGVAPNEFIATKYVNDTPASGVAFQRPLCLFPEVARYKGSGDPTAASSFACVKESHGASDDEMSSPFGSH